MQRRSHAPMNALDRPIHLVYDGTMGLFLALPSLLERTTYRERIDSVNSDLTEPEHAEPVHLPRGPAGRREALRGAHHAGLRPWGHRRGGSGPPIADSRRATMRNNHASHTRLRMRSLQYGDNALHWACIVGSPECVRVLMKNGVRANAVNKVRAGVRPAVIAPLRASGQSTAAMCPLTAPDVEQRGWSPLHFAVREGHISVVREIMGGSHEHVDLEMTTDVRAGAWRAPLQRIAHGSLALSVGCAGRTVSDPPDPPRRRHQRAVHQAAAPVRRLAAQRAAVRAPGQPLIAATRQGAQRAAGGAGDSLAHTLPTPPRSPAHISVASHLILPRPPADCCRARPRCCARCGSATCATGAGARRCTGCACADTRMRRARCWRTARTGRSRTTCVLLRARGGAAVGERRLADRLRPHTDRSRAHAWPTALRSRTATRPVTWPCSSATRGWRDSSTTSPPAMVRRGTLGHRHAHTRARPRTLPRTSSRRWCCCAATRRREAPTHSICDLARTSPPRCPPSVATAVVECERCGLYVLLGAVDRHQSSAECRNYGEHARGCVRVGERERERFARPARARAARSPGSNSSNPIMPFSLARASPSNAAQACCSRRSTSPGSPLWCSPRRCCSCCTCARSWPTDAWSSHRCIALRRRSRRSMEPPGPAGLRPPAKTPALAPHPPSHPCTPARARQHMSLQEARDMLAWVQQLLDGDVPESLVRPDCARGCARAGCR